MPHLDNLNPPTHPVENLPTHPIAGPPSIVEVASHPYWDRVIRVAEQIRLLGVGRTQFYELARAPDFPEEIVLGKRARGRWLSELIAFIDSRKHRIACTRDEDNGDV